MSSKITRLSNLTTNKLTSGDKKVTDPKDVMPPESVLGVSIYHDCYLFYTSNIVDTCEYYNNDNITFNKWWVIKSFRNFDMHMLKNPKKN